MFAVRCPALLLQILRFAQNDNERAQNDISGHHRRSLSPVTIDAAAEEISGIAGFVRKLARKVECPWVVIELIL